MVQYLDLEEDARVHGDGAVPTASVFLIPRVFEHHHQPPVRRHGEVLAAEVFVLVRQPRRDGGVAGELAGVNVALPRLDVAGVGDGQEATAVVYGVLDVAAGGRHPPRGVLRRREGRGADGPVHDEHGGVAARVRRRGEDDLAVDELPHLGGRDRVRRRALPVSVLRRRRRASETHLQEGRKVEEEPAATVMRLDEGDGGDGRQVGVRSGDRVSHAEGGPVVGGHEPPAGGTDDDVAAQGDVRSAHGGGFAVGQGQDRGLRIVLLGAREEEPRRRLQLQAADGGEGEAAEEVEAVVDLGQ